MGKSELPLVCICIPTYNVEGTLGETLESVLGQTYSNLVVHVVDNASTDGTLAVAMSFGDSRITIHQNSENVGGEGNFNRCIALARGKYTAIYHADDLYEPTIVERQVAFLEDHPQASAVFVEAQLIDECGALIGVIRKPADLAVAGPLHDFTSVFKAILKNSNFLICPSVMASTRLFQDEIKAWRGELFSSGADLDVWLRMLQYGPIGLIPEPLMRYRISDKQWSAKVRQDTRRADFFTVVDYYLAMKDVRSELTEADINNYERLERRDKAMRAANALLQDQRNIASQLCSEVLWWRCFMDALRSKRGQLTLILFAYVRIVLLTGMHQSAKALLMRMKQIIKK